ncbi:unnamed protein product, partial [Polarella glacialis]
DSNRARRRLFSKLLARLPSATMKVLRHLLSALLSLCRDCLQADEAAVAARDHELEQRRSPPARPGGEELKKMRRSRLDEVLQQMRACDIWRKALLSRDGPTQLVAVTLCHTVAPALSDEDLLSCLGLILEAEGSLRERSSPDAEDHQHNFAREMLAVCIAACHRRSDVERGEVAPCVLGFLVRAAILEEGCPARSGFDRGGCVFGSSCNVCDKALEYWEAQLSAEAPTRLAQLCSRLGSSSENEAIFIPAVMQLMMALGKRSAEYRKKLVKPLSDCEFRPLQVSAAASSWAATGLPQTFRLGASWAEALRASLGGGTQLQQGGFRSRARGLDGASSVAQSLSDEAVPPQLRAGRRLQGQTMTSSSSQAGSQALRHMAASALGDEATTTTGQGLLRHSDADAKRSSILATERQTKAALAALERREREGGDEDKAQLLNEYRTGPHPDVEVSVEDVLKPLSKAALEDISLAEELLLALWSGITSASAAGGAAAAAADAQSEVLTRALTGLLSGCSGDVAFVHFLHSVVIRCGGSLCSRTLPLSAFQRTLGASQLSGIQALEEMLPRDGDVETAAGGGGRQRALLSALYGGSAALGEQPSMAAVVDQLGAIHAFASKHSAPALHALRESKALEAEQLLARVLDDEETAVPSWELQMASAARLNALEDLMSWGTLRDALRVGMPEESGHGETAQEARLLRTELGLSILEDDQAAKATLDLRLQQAASSQLEGSLVSSARAKALLAAQAISTRKFDDARRLIYEGYDAFGALWPRLPLLAARARHEALSSLPLLRGLEVFVEAPEMTPATSRPLSLLHDRFSAWVDAALAKIVVARSCRDKQAEASAYHELGRRCREAGNLHAAQDMMKRCLQSRERHESKFFAEVMELKLRQGASACETLCGVIQTETKKHKEPEHALRYNLILANVAKVGWERREIAHELAWTALSTCKTLAEQCGASEQGLANARLAEFADAVLRRSEEAGDALSPSDPQQVEVVEALIGSVLRALQLGGTQGGGSGHDGRSECEEAFRQAHERLPRVFELLAVFQCSSPCFEHGVRSVPPWPFLRWLPQALAHLPKVPALLGPLQALAQEFPQALFWPLQLSSHQDVVGDRGSVFRPLWAELQRSQAPIKLALTFTKALESLTHPETIFPQELKRFREAFAAGDLATAKARWASLWSRRIEVEARDISGLVHVEFGQRIRQKLQDLGRKLGLAVCRKELPDSELEPGRRQAWQKLLQELGPLPTSRHQRGKAPLEAFSPWLARFDARGSWLGSAEEQLEVLGQYRGFERPDPRSHARITRFGSQLLVMASKQKPKRLVVLGSDEQEHWFLVKGGEDVRLDERVEQLFGAVNGLVARDAAVGLRVRTYAVVPLLP